MTDREIGFPRGAFRAALRVPGDKSLGHRACIFAAMARGTSVVTGLSDGADVRSTIAVLDRLGVARDGDRITSPGIARWVEPSDALECGNSGTTMRIMTGVLARSDITATLVGDASLSRRPMGRLVGPLQALGADVRVSPEGTAPVRVRGTALVGADVAIPIASAQVRTAVALAALGADGSTTITSPPGFRDHTERWLEHLGLARRESDVRLVVFPGEIPPLTVAVPGDPSSAAYAWAAAAVRPGSCVTTEPVSLNPGRLGFLDILRRMGAHVEVRVTGDLLSDPIGSVTVEARDLHGVAVSGDDVAAAIDELPLLAVVAAAADGVTTVSDAAELRAKESDRLSASVRLARLAGAAAIADGSGFTVGVGDRDTTDRIDGEGDHRVVMAGAIASLVRGAPVVISGFEASAVSWPGFADALEGLWS